MKIIGLRELQAFKDRHADVRSQVDAWRNEVETAQWNTPLDVTERYASASILSDNQVVFNLKGNKYRLLVKISYKNKIVFVKKAGTHAEYSKWTL
jgi:mRNA interferase HigB